MFAILVLAMSLQNTPANPGVGTLIGKWTTTVQPPAGEAPAISPTFTIELNSQEVIVVLSSGKDRYPATVFEADKGQSILVLKVPDTRSGTRTIIIRPIATGQVRFEMFVERQQQGKAKNFYYAEVFRKGR